MPGNDAADHRTCGHKGRLRGCGHYHGCVGGAHLECEIEPYLSADVQDDTLIDELLEPLGLRGYPVVAFLETGEIVYSSGVGFCCGCNASIDSRCRHKRVLNYRAAGVRNGTAQAGVKV